MRKLYYILLLLILSLVAHAQYHTRSLNTNIRTLRIQYLSEALEPSGNPQRPYLVLKDGIVDGNEEDNTLEISFDELSHDTKLYSYKVEHCDRYWNKSNISSYEYLDGFTSADIVDYELSNNTQQTYTHYWFTFPNNDMQLKASGNYLITIYQDGDVNNVVAHVCFSVVEPLVDIHADIRVNTDIELNGRYQQLDIDLNTAELNLRDAQDVAVVVTQNGRIDNRVIVNKPTFVEPKKLRYINNKSLIFEAGNEFRHFDSYSVYYAGYHIDRVVYSQGEYHAIIEQDAIRGTLANGASKEGLPYLSDIDANGQWVVNCEKSDYPDVDAEYMWVHFCLPVKQPIMDAQIFVGGDLFYNQYTADNLMQYDPENQCYYLYAYLKQGGYNYMYCTVGPNGSSLLPIEGSHWQTENEYAVWVYYRPFGARYDRLVAAKRL